METWLRYLIAFVVFAHGFIYVRIGSVLPSPIKGWRGTSWLLGDSFTRDQLRWLVVSLHVAAGIAILACAAAIAFAPSLPGWWRPLAITTFRLPCPTTLLTIGWLFVADPPWPKVVVLVPIAWALIGGSAATLLGVRTDLMLWVAGIALTALVLIPVPHRVRA